MKTFDFKQETIEEILQSEFVMFTYPSKLNNYCIGSDAIRLFFLRCKHLPFLYEVLTKEEFSLRISIDNI